MIFKENSKKRADEEKIERGKEDLKAKRSPPDRFPAVLVLHSGIAAGWAG